MDLKTFQSLPTDQIAALVRAQGPKVCVFIINGTRRWAMLEHAQDGADLATIYFEAVSKRMVELCALFFAHGIDTLLLPAFNGKLMARGSRYTAMMVEGLRHLTQLPRFLDFYQEYQVRVRFYGEHRQCFATTPYADLSDQFDALTKHTESHHNHRLFFGVCAQDSTERIAQLAIDYHTNHGTAPDKKALTALYYGEYIPPAELFLSSGKLHVSDIPLLSSGQEQLYFTIAPAPYLSVSQFRHILYDYLYIRSNQDSDYEAMQQEDWQQLRHFYQANLQHTLGLGRRQMPGGIWHPLPQVSVPTEFLNDE